MATVALKDLMDPLSKIAASTQSTLDSVKSLRETVTVSTNIIQNVQRSILTETQLQSDLLKNIAENIATGNRNIIDMTKSATEREQAKTAAEVKTESGQNLKNGAEALGLLGGSISLISKGMLSFSTVPRAIIWKFTNFIKNLLFSLNNTDTESSLRGAQAFEIISRSVIVFAKNLALSALLLIPGMLGIPFLISSIGVLSLAIAGIGLMEKRINTGADVLSKISSGIIAFATGLATFALTTFFILMAPAVIPAMVGALLLIGGSVAALGLAGKQIEEGSESLLFMGIGLSVFSLGYAFFAAVSNKISLEQIGIQAAILGGIGLTVGLLGLASQSIIKGSVGLGLMGLALITFGAGYWLFANSTKDIKIGDVGVQMAVLGGVGLTMAAVGAVVALTGGAALLGPVLFGLAGLSLLVLAPGLAAMKKLNFKEEDARNLSYTLGAVAMAFSGAKSKDGFFQNVGNIFGRVVQSGGMLAAAGGYMAAGVALLTLSKGLKRYKELKWKDDDTKKLANMLTSVSVAFASAAGDGELIDGGGFIGTVFGVKRTRVEEGISSVMSAGKALTGIAKGLSSFQNLIASNVKFGDPSLGPDKFYGGKDTLAYAVINTVGFVQQAFSAVGSEGNVAAGGFFNSLFNIKKNKVEEGIRSVLDAGDALSGIANGLTGFQKLVDSNVSFGDPANPIKGTLAYAVINTLGFVRAAFGAVTDEGNVQGGGFFNTLFNIKKNKVEEGIRSVQGAGTELSGIADGLTTFQKLITNEVDFDILGDRISKTLGIVRGAFAMVGGETQKTGFSLGLLNIGWDQNKVETGISAVSGAGETIKEIAEGLTAYTKMEDPNKVAMSISNLLQTLSSTLSRVYDQPEFSTRLQNFQEFIGFMGARGSDGSLTQMAISLSDSAPHLDSISKSYMIISETKPKSLKLFKDIIYDIDSHSYKKQAKGLESIASSMEIIESTSNGVDIYAVEKIHEMFEAAAKMGDGSETKIALEALQDAIIELKEFLNGDGISGFANAVRGAMGDFQNALGLSEAPSQGNNNSTENPNLKVTLNRLQSTLQNMDRTLSGLPSDIAAIEIKMPEEF